MSSSELSNGLLESTYISTPSTTAPPSVSGLLGSVPSSSLRIPLPSKSQIIPVSGFIQLQLGKFPVNSHMSSNPSESVSLLVGSVPYVIISSPSKSPSPSVSFFVALVTYPSEPVISSPSSNPSPSVSEFVAFVK